MYGDDAASSKRAWMFGEICLCWSDRYYFSITTAGAYALAAVIIACAQRGSRQSEHHQAWALRKWVWRCLLVSCVCRVLMFLGQSRDIACSADLAVANAGRGALVLLQGLGFALNWACALRR